MLTLSAIPLENQRDGAFRNSILRNTPGCPNAVLDIEGGNYDGKILLHHLQIRN
jgi:hypothetical protein